jgi:hypothetical protein
MQSISDNEKMGATFQLILSGKGRELVAVVA